MDQATCASELAKKINILDAILWLKNAWDALDPATIERCFAKCGFIDTAVDIMIVEEANSLTSHMSSFVIDSGTTWQDYCISSNSSSVVY